MRFEGEIGDERSLCGRAGGCGDARRIDGTGGAVLSRSGWGICAPQIVVNPRPALLWCEVVESYRQALKKGAAVIVFSDPIE